MDFKGHFTLNRKLDDATAEFLIKLSRTRRMGRLTGGSYLDAKYGIQGEFYVEDDSLCVIDANRAPATQPGLWCQWIPTSDRRGIEWNGGEKFYNYIEWIKYIISKVLAPRGYILNGSVEWKGEESDDRGAIHIVDNVVNGERLVVDYSINNLLGKVTFASYKNPLAGIRADGTKTKHQIAKEKRESEMKVLTDELTSLKKKLEEKEKQLQSEKIAKDKEEMSIQDLMIEKIRRSSGFGGTLDEFKNLLKNMLE